MYRRLAELYGWDANVISRLTMGQILMYANLPDETRPDEFKGRTITKMSIEDAAKYARKR